MAVDKISQLSHRIFNTSITEKNVARSSNPFAAKNILTVDTFESSVKKEHKLNLGDNLTASSKRIYSTFVGSISNFGNKIIEGVESIIAFGNRMKDGVVSVWNKIHEIGNTEISFEGAKNILSKDISSFFNLREKEIVKMSKMDPINEVKPMFMESLSALEADLAAVA